MGQAGASPPRTRPPGAAAGIVLAVAVSTPSGGPLEPGKKLTWPPVLAMEQGQECHLYKREDVVKTGRLTGLVWSQGRLDSMGQ